MRIKLATPLIGEFPRYANVVARNLRLNPGMFK
jgi:hypothetical protein